MYIFRQCCILPCIYINIYTCVYMQNESQRHNDKGRAKTSWTKYTSHYIVTFACESQLETEQNCNILTPTLMAVSVVSFSFSRAAQPEAQGPSSLLDDGFLYCLLSPTGLQNSIGGPESRFGWVWLFLTTTFLQRLWSPVVWLPVLTELYSSSTPTHSPTQSLEWHVWSTSSGNNCHAVHSLPVHQSLSVRWDFLPCPILSAKPAYAISSHNCHWNVSLPSGALLWNGKFGRVEGQYITGNIFSFKQVLLNKMEFMFFSFFFLFFSRVLMFIGCFNLEICLWFFQRSHLWYTV